MTRRFHVEPGTLDDESVRITGPLAHRLASVLRVRAGDDVNLETQRRSIQVELPEVGAQVTKDDPFGVVESVKAVSDIFAPVSGTVTEVNGPLADSPEMVNEDPYGDAWMIRVELSDADELEDLMTAAEYQKFLEEEQEE